MSTRGKQIALVIVAQSVCIAAGMWAHHRYTISTLRADMEQETAARLHSALSAAVSGLESAQADYSHPASLQHLLDSRCTPSERLFVADHNWRVLAASLEGPQAPPLGTIVSFQPEPHALSQPAPASISATEPTRGLLTFADSSGARHTAIVQPVRAGQALVVAHQPKALVESRLAALTQRLVVVELMTAIWSLALLGLAAYLILSRVLERLERARVQSSNDALRRTQHLIRTRDAVIFGLAKLADSRDRETGDHLERIAAYSTALASAVRSHPRFHARIDSAFVRLIGVSSALHDIGKVAIADQILRKPGPLTPEERERMQTHAKVGGECLRDIERRLGSSNFLQMAREIALAHHERWDGTGYPDGLVNDEIPLSARIVAIADEYDALSSPRVYKPAYPHATCVEMIAAEAGLHFDPDIVAAFLGIEQDVRQLADRYTAKAPAAVAMESDRGGQQDLHEGKQVVGKKELAPQACGQSGHVL